MCIYPEPCPLFCWVTENVQYSSEVRCKESISEKAQVYTQPQRPNTSLEALFKFNDAYEVTKPMSMVVGAWSNPTFEWLPCYKPGDGGTSVINEEERSLNFS